MSLVVLLILALVWAVFLVPQVLRARSEGRPSDSIGAFQKQLSVLERTSPAGHGSVTSLRPTYRLDAPTLLLPTRNEIRKRRRDILLGLLAAMTGSLVLGLIPGLRVMLGLHLVLDVLFGAYVFLLVRARALATERDVKVRYLPGAASPEPALLLRRSAN